MTVEVDIAAVAVTAVAALLIIVIQRIRIRRELYRDCDGLDLNRLIRCPGYSRGLHKVFDECRPDSMEDKRRFVAMAALTFMTYRTRQICGRYGENLFLEAKGYAREMEQFFRDNPDAEIL